MWTSRMSEEKTILNAIRVTMRDQTAATNRCLTSLQQKPWSPWSILHHGPPNPGTKQQFTKCECLSTDRDAKCLQNHKQHVQSLAQCCAKKNLWGFCANWFALTGTRPSQSTLPNPKFYPHSNLCPIIQIDFPSLLYTLHILILS
jgi:hypothetical protein